MIPPIVYANPPSPAIQNRTLDFPHSCFPGNTNTNGGFGVGHGTEGFAFTIGYTSTAANSFTLRLSANAGCNPGLSGALGCCQSDTKKVEFVVNSGCRASILNVTSTGPSPPLAPSYSIQTWAAPPAGWTGPTSPLVAKVTGLDTAGQDMDVTITLRAPCATVDSFLYGSQGQLWFAAYGDDTGKVNSCCGTGSVLP